jgi:CheY-like chemotaxis protein
MTRPDTNSEYVLIVEDDDDLRDGLAELLVDEGHTVRTASNGREALDYLSSHPAPCIIILDLMMPVMDGEQFRAEQLADPALSSVPIVVLTASHDGAQRAENLGAHEYLPKPIKVDALIDAIHAHC